MSGTGVERRDYAKAVNYLNLAAQNGHVLSVHKLAQMTLYGIGTPKSCDSALALFKNVAEKGPWIDNLNHAYAMYYRDNAHEALQEYLKISEQGYEVAQSNAAWLLDTGVGLSGHPDVDLDKEESASSSLSSSNPRDTGDANSSDEEKAQSITTSGLFSWFKSAVQQLPRNAVKGTAVGARLHKLAANQQHCIQDHSRGLLLLRSGSQRRRYAEGSAAISQSSSDERRTRNV